MANVIEITRTAWAQLDSTVPACGKGLFGNGVVVSPVRN